METINTNANNNNTVINEYCPEIIKTYSFTPRETVLAFAAVIIGFLFIKLSAAPMIMARSGLGTAIVLICTTVFSTVYRAQRNHKYKISLIRLALCILFSANVFISSNIIIQLLDTIFVLLVIVYDNLAVHEKFSSIRHYFLSDIFSSAITLPFSEFGACTAAIKSNAEKSRSEKYVKNTFIGLAMAVIPTIFVCTLLMRADSFFESIISSLLNDSLYKIIVFVLQFLIGIPTACYIYGMCRASDKNNCESLINDEYTDRNIRSCRFIPSMAGVVSAVPVCILYAVFFFSQITYFISAFSSKLPEGVEGYAAYARRGFFELCTVAVINLTIIIAINLFCKYNENGSRPLSIRIISCVLCVFTIFLIATAVSKMVMYIDVYGLTSLRIYTTWFMILLAVLFIGIFIKMLSHKFNLAKISVTAFIIMFSVLSFLNVDGIIAGYNTERYINGSLPYYNISSLRELSTGAVPAAMRIKDKLSENDAQELDAAIEKMLFSSKIADARSLTLNDILARRAYEEN